MPTINVGDTVAFRDRKGEPLGELTVQENRYGAWCGSFAPAAGYAPVRSLFIEWTTLVNEQCFSLLDAVDDKISAIGIAAFHGNEPMSVRDIQIYDEGSELHGSFKLVT